MVGGDVEKVQTWREKLSGTKFHCQERQLSPTNSFLFRLKYYMPSIYTELVYQSVLSSPLLNLKINYIATLLQRGQSQKRFKRVKLRCGCLIQACRPIQNKSHQIRPLNSSAYCRLKRSLPAVIQVSQHKLRIRDYYVLLEKLCMINFQKQFCFS